MPPLPQMPPFILVLIMIVVLGWGIGVLMLIKAFRAYVEKTNALINRLYSELEPPNDRETVELPEMDMDNVY